MPRRRLQFRLRTLLLAQISIALGLFTYPHWSAIDLRPAEYRPIDWQPFSQAALDDAQTSGRPVLVQYYARWDITGMYTLKWSLERPAVRREIVEGRFVPLLADWTDCDQEVTASLQSHGYQSIPLTVIYSADLPQRPAVLGYLPTEARVLSALRQAARPTDGPPRFHPTTTALVGGLGILFLIGLAHALARTQR